MTRRTTVLLLCVILLTACLSGCAANTEPQVLADETESNQNGSDAPAENHFKQTVFVQGMDEPMELDLLDDGRILYIERPGSIKIVDPDAGTVTFVDSLDVFHQLEDGLLGLAVDPDYTNNHWIYLFYSPPGDEAKQHVSRFVLQGDSLSAETIVLVIHNQRDECCHAAGSLEFGPDGNLFIAVGDNTNPFASDGFNPIDEQPGRSPWDAQKSAANPNDLRGKILRIKPESDGTYSIPEGNLFPEGTEGTRPEIYAMGLRNPYRMAIDRRTGYLYWGDVGPDAGADNPTRGPQGHDEINQARTPGFFGWPYFIGNNKPYHDYDFGPQTSGPLFDPTAPVNDSPNNTGIQTLPPAQPAFIWYPYGPSAEFPLLGAGGRTAVAGPVFYWDDYEDTARRFPPYYDGKLFIYEWMRDQIFVVTMNEQSDYESIERFLPSTTFSNPIDMLFGPDGAMYLLEYGNTWNAANPDARLSRIDYIGE